MKNLEIDDQLYQYIAANTQYIGESASDILRRLLKLDKNENTTPQTLSQEPSNQVVKPIPETKNTPHENKERADVFNYINKEELAMQRGAVGRFLLILAALYGVNQQDFQRVLTIRGRDRLYFATTEQALSESGSSTKPRQIPDSPFWVMTNSNTTRKKMMLTEAALALGYSSEDAEKIRELLK